METLALVLKARSLKALSALVNAKAMSCLISKATATLAVLTRLSQVVNVSAAPDTAEAHVECVCSHAQPINLPSKVLALPALLTLSSTQPSTDVLAHLDTTWTLMVFARNLS